MHNHTAMAALSLTVIAAFANHHCHPRLQPLSSPPKKRGQKPTATELSVRTTWGCEG